MKHKSLGIIQIDLPEITLEDTFNAQNVTIITSLLNEEQKKLLVQACKGEKLVVINGNIKDSNNLLIQLRLQVVAPNICDGKYIFIITSASVSDDAFYHIVLYTSDLETFAIYS